jgi:predicted flap endonuclease-1-like 5' DNA nuclease
MSIQNRLVELDKMVETGLWLEAVELFYDAQVRSHSNLTGLANGKAEKKQKLSSFLERIKKTNSMRVLMSHVLDDRHTISEIQYDLNMSDGSSAQWSEQVKRTWKNDMVVEEKYYLSEGLGASVPTKIINREKPVVREVILNREVPLVKEVIVEHHVDREVFIQREVPVVKEVVLEKEVAILHHNVVENRKQFDITVTREIPVIHTKEVEKEVRYEVIKEVPKINNIEILVEVESPLVREVEIKKPVISEVVVEKEMPYRIQLIKEIPVYQEVIIEREVPVIVHKYVDKEVVYEVIVEREVPVTREVIIEREVPVIKEVIVEKIVEIIKEVIVEKLVEREVILEIEVPVIKEVIVEKPVEREVIIEREVPVIKHVYVDKQVITEIAVINEVPVERTISIQHQRPQLVQNVIEIATPVIQETAREIQVNTAVVREEIVSTPFDVLVKTEKAVIQLTQQEVEIIHEVVEQVPVTKTIIVQKSVPVIEEQIVEIQVPIVHQKAVEREVEFVINLVNEVPKIVENVTDVEVITEVAVYREVPVEREVSLTREVLANVREVFTNVPVDRDVRVEREIATMHEIVAEVEVPVIQEVIVERTVPVLREKIVEKIVEHEVIVEKEVHVTREVIVEKPVIREVFIEREVPVIKEIVVDREVIHEVTIERNSKTQRSSMSQADLNTAQFSKNYTTRQVAEKEIVARERGIDPEMELLRYGNIEQLDAAAQIVEYEIPVGMKVETVHTSVRPNSTSSETVITETITQQDSTDAPEVVNGTTHITTKTVETVGAASSDQERDNLQIIEGIGPKIQELLYNGGVFTFQQMANTSIDQLRGILSEAGPRYIMHDPVTWPAQALLAARGNWDELKSWQNEMKGGRG